MVLSDNEAQAVNYYDFLDRQINECINGDVGFTCLVRAEPYRLDPAEVEAFKNRYTHIKQYQETTLSLFAASLKGDVDPQVAALVLNELPKNMSWDYHRALSDAHRTTPVFFRTDEVIPGKISEIQCPASLWGEYEQLYRFYSHFSEDFGPLESFPHSLAGRFAKALARYLGCTPAIHHLIDNASVPWGMTFFNQMLKQNEVRFYGLSKGVTPYNCNFIRCHDFVGLFGQNFAKLRLEKCRAGELFYDLPPSILFEEKIGLTFPFWEKTRAHYTDEVRDLFPYTHVILPEGFHLEDGRFYTPEQFCEMPRSQRNYFIKYAGCDVALNWGAKGVYYAKALSQVKIREIFDQIIKDAGKNRYWVIQKGYSKEETVPFYTREGKLQNDKAHSKYSGFYGPDGLMGILVMQRPFYKVHGSDDTVASIVA